MQGYIFYPLQGIFIWVFQWNFPFLCPSHKLLSLPDRARSTDNQPQAARFVNKSSFWSLSCSRHLSFPFWWEKYTLYDEVSLIFSLFCLTVHLSKCTRGLLHKPPVFEICLALRARISTQYVRCFCQELVLRHLYIGPAISFIVGNSCASFPPFWDLCTF